MNGLGNTKDLVLKRPKPTKTSLVLTLPPRVSARKDSRLANFRSITVPKQKVRLISWYESISPVGSLGLSMGYGLIEELKAPGPKLLTIWGGVTPSTPLAPMLFIYLTSEYNSLADPSLR